VAVLCHNVVPHDASSWQLWLIRRLFAAVPEALVHSNDEAAAARRLGADAVEVAALPFFLPAEVHVAAGADTPTLRLLFFGFVRPYKGLDVLVDAVAAASTRVSLRVVGEFWEPVESFRAQAAGLGLADRVDLEDRYLESDQIPALFDGVDALVVPYRSATGSQHPRLGHLAGVPVIVTEVGDLPTQVTDGVDGVVCAPDDVASLAAAIDRLYEPGVLEAMRRRIGEHPPPDDWPDYVAAVERLGP
jgi:glycosyltransferase involved in cell wall biosynthesis